jgi:hypothetical protein
MPSALMSRRWACAADRVAHSEFAKRGVPAQQIVSPLRDRADWCSVLRQKLSPAEVDNVESVGS